jgi:hypothetical protein
MSAPSDPSDDSSLAARLLRLEQVSDAATALTRSTRVAIPHIRAASKIPVEPSKFISLSVRPADSFIPAIHAKSHVRSSRRLATFVRLITTLAVAATILLVTGELSPTNIIRPSATDNGATNLFFSPVTPDAVEAIPVEQARPRLIIQASRGTSDEPTPLGLAVEGPAEAAVVYIEGLVPGMELSTGRPVGTAAWELPATELGHAWIAPPRGFVGTPKLVAELRLPDNQLADRQPIDVAWERPISPEPMLPQVQELAALQALSADPDHIRPDRDEAGPSQPVAVVTAGQRVGGEDLVVVPSIAPAPIHLQDDQHEVPLMNGKGAVLEPIQLIPDRDQIVAADPSAPTFQHQLDDEEITALLKRGKDLIASGDLAAARVVLRKAADANNAEAALALAATYDPFVLRELKVYGFRPDAGTARLWYEKAIELGSPAAPRRLEMLTQGTATR